MDLFATNYININRKKRKRIKNKDSSLKITYTKDSKVEQARLIKWTPTIAQDSRQKKVQGKCWCHGTKELKQKNKTIQQQISDLSC